MLEQGYWVSACVGPTKIRLCFNQLGISDRSPLRVDVLTDSEPLIGSTLKRLGLPLQVKAAAPQAHESIGLAERNVRREGSGFVSQK